MKRAKGVICRDCIAGAHSEHDLEGCTKVVQRWVQEGEESKELCSCVRLPQPLKVPNILKLKIPSR